MAWISGGGGLSLQAFPSELKTANGLSYHPNARKDDPLSVRLMDGENPRVDFEFGKLPTDFEFLVEIFHNARADSLSDAHDGEQRYPVALSCHSLWW